MGREKDGDLKGRGGEAGGCEAVDVELLIVHPLGTLAERLGRTRRLGEVGRPEKPPSRDPQEDRDQPWSTSQA